MHRPDQFDDGHELPSELPELPIPRPGEGPVERAPAPQPIAPPRLGGGASFTSVGGAGEMPMEPPQPPGRPSVDELSAADRERLESERFTWELAARLTSGMLSNPARNQSSVKDAMALFDQFLQEMHAYARIASEFDLTGADQRRRRDHSEYFQVSEQQQLQHEQALRLAQQQAIGGVAPVPIPVPKPQPAQPAPMSGYQPLPPNARAPYMPGSMAGPPPPMPEAGFGELEDDAA